MAVANKKNVYSVAMEMNYYWPIPVAVRIGQLNIQFCHEWLEKWCFDSTLLLQIQKDVSELVEQMEKTLEEIKGATPSRDMVQSLAEKFNAAPERAGNVPVQTKQVLSWFYNRRRPQKAKSAIVPVTSNSVPPPPANCPAKSVIVNSVDVPSGGKALDSLELEFEARSAKDGAWYDVATFLTHRILESGEPEVRVRFVGFGAEEDEWVNVRRAVRQRSLPCEASECVSVLPGDLILCFREDKDQSIYFDAHVVEVQRKRHDVRGCRCRFLIRYDHDQSEERVPLRRVYRRPEI